MIVLSFAVVIIGGLAIAASLLRKRFEPYIRAKAVSYLQKRFDSDVTLSGLRVRIPSASPLHILFTGGRGTLARVEGEGLTVRQRQRHEFPPILILKRFSFDIDLGAVFDSPPSVDRIVLEGMTITIPPKSERKPLQPSSQNGALIREIVAKDSELVIVPKLSGKQPLTFDLKELHLWSVSNDQPVSYTAVLRNPKPPGLVRSSGVFGPWSEEDPGSTLLSGNYSFQHADLSVFPAIAGILESTGNFSGTFSAINARGTASVPDFRLSNIGNAVPLQADFQVLVDGGNGNTILDPVHATLGTTQFTTSGGVIRENGDAKRTIALEAIMPGGELKDVLRLAMKGKPFMEGKIALRTKIEIPPLTGTVKEKLKLDGRFEISRGRFLRSGIRSKVDALSRRGQGEPKNEEISDVFSGMTGRFRMENQDISFRSLTFATPGAKITLAGDYNIGGGTLDFRGSLALKAKVSQTVTGWKSWLLKPVDPFLEKNGAGTFLPIKIGGTAKSPDFGLDLGGREKTEQ